MRSLLTALLVIILFACNNNKTETAKTDSLAINTNPVDTMHKMNADTAKEEYCNITAVEKRHDSIFIKADYVQFFTGKNVVEEAKKRHRADTSFDKNGKIEDIFVPDDYFIVNDNKEIRTLYLPAGTPVTMDSQIAGEKAKDINTYAYFSQHFKNSLFKLMVKNNRIESVQEVFLP